MADFPANLPVYSLSQNSAPTNDDFFVMQESGATGDVKLVNMLVFLKSLADKTDDGWCFNGVTGLELDVGADPGTEDGDLYAAIVNIGWDSEVIE